MTETLNESLVYEIVSENEIDPDALQEIQDLMTKTFGEVVDEQEVVEDFIAPCVARLTVRDGEELIGCANIHLVDTEVSGVPIKLGGFSGVIVIDEYRRKGIGSEISRRCLEYLDQIEADVAFLSANEISKGMYVKLGFGEIPAGFTWENFHGETKFEQDDGMLIAVKSQGIYDEIMNGKKPLHVGRGYW